MKAQITDKWKERKLGDIADVTSSKRVFASDYVDSGVPFYRSREVIERSRGNNISTELFISNEKYQAIKDRFGVPKAGDILITSVGTLGVPYLVGEDEVFYFKDGNLIWLRDFKRDITDPKFVYYSIINPLTQSRLKSISIGSSQSAFTISAIKDFSLSFPELVDQRLISNTITFYDDLILNHGRRIDVLQRIVQKTYKEWFLSSGSHKKDWPTMKLKDCLDLFRGKSYTGTDLEESVNSVPLVNLKCIKRNGGFRKDGLKSFSGKYKDSHIVRKGDIVMAVTDMTQERMIVARSARVPSLGVDFGVISMDLIKIEPRENCDKDFLYAYLRWSDFADNVKNYANGANVLHLLPDRVAEYEISLPPMELQSKFSSIVKDIFEQIDVLELACDNLKKTRDLLIPQLVTGKLTIKS